jgi:hypothetical protein
MMPLVDFNSGDVMTGPGYGWGPGLSRALGGLSPGDFRLIGATGAKAGKTWFECFLANGLMLATACRLLGVPRFAEAPIVVPVWVSEMPKKGELTWRLVGQCLGFDVAALSKGTDAAQAPGIAYMARKYSMTPDEVVAHARMLERMHRDERFPLGFARRHLLHLIDLVQLPGARGRGTVDHKTGPVLIDHVADTVDMLRHDFAGLAGVPESEVIPLVLVDPGQRFAGGGADSKSALDDFFNAIVQLLCRELGCCVLGTSDTTKAAAKEIDVDVFLGKDGGALAADIYAGSYAILHNCDPIAVCAEKPEPGSLTTTQWVRLLLNRDGAAAEAYPFTWDMHLGRFRAREARPLTESKKSSESARPTAEEHMSGYPEMGTVLVEIPYGDDSRKMQVKSVGGQWDRSEKAWRCEAHLARAMVEDERLKWRRSQARPVVPAGHALPRPVDLPRSTWDD